MAIQHLIQTDFVTKKVPVVTMCQELFTVCIWPNTLCYYALPGLKKAPEQQHLQIHPNPL